MDVELSSLRIKADYLNKKYEEERAKLLKLTQKKQLAQQREEEQINRETELIESARIKHGIDFESTEQIRKR